MIPARQKYVLLVFTIALFAWIVGAGLLLPRIVASMYAGESYSFLNEMISGQTDHPLEFYLKKIHYLFVPGLVLITAIALLFYNSAPRLPVLRGLAIAWNRYWFRPTNTSYLALARIVCVTTVLALNIKRFGYILGLTKLPDELYEPLLLNRILLLPFDSAVQPSETALLVIVWLTLALGFAALIGFRTNISLLLFALGNAFIVGYKYSFRDFHHPEAVMAIALWLLALAPSGRRFSIDALIALRKHGVSFGVESHYGAWPLLLIQVLLTMVYLDSGIQKLYFSGLEWMNGTTLAYYLTMDGIGRGSALAGHLLGHQWLLIPLSVLTIFLETTFWVVLFRPKLAWLYVPLGLGFHFGNLILHIAPFYEFMALYVVFLPNVLGTWTTSPFKFLRHAADATTKNDSTSESDVSEGTGIVLFDGECNFCNGWVRFVFARDPMARFHFAALQSTAGRALLEERNLDSESMDSIVLLTRNDVFQKSTAAIEILRQLGFPWTIARLFLFLPRPLRDRIYDWVARNRYRWFGKRELCEVPSPEMRHRMLT